MTAYKKAARSTVDQSIKTFMNAHKGLNCGMTHDQKVKNWTNGVLKAPGYIPVKDWPKKTLVTDGPLVPVRASIYFGG
jgi:hypothetical protein